MLNVMKIQIEAGKFLEAVDCLTIENIKHWLSKKGYTLHYFSEDEAESLNVDKDEKGFKRKSELLKIVYIKDSMAYKDKLETIIHECGHVLFDDSLALKTVKYRELVANLFSEYVSNPNKILYCFYKLFKPRYICLFLVVALLLGVCNDLFTYPEKYMPARKYHLENRIRRGEPEAIKYYNDVYIANGVELFE